MLRPPSLCHKKARREYRLITFLCISGLAMGNINIFFPCRMHPKTSNYTLKIPKISQSINHSLLLIASMNVAIQLAEITCITFYNNKYTTSNLYQTFPLKRTCFNSHCNIENNISKQPNCQSTYLNLKKKNLTPRAEIKPLMT